MKYMALPSLPAAHDLDVRRQVVGVKQGHDLTDLAGVEVGKQRNARHERPGDDEIAPVDLLREARRDDRHRERQNAEPRDHDDAAEEASERA